MNLPSSKDSHELRSFIELGTRGHFPLFPSSWIGDVFKEHEKNDAANDDIKNILKKLSKHRSLDRKKTILLSLTEDERTIFIKEFFKMVENKILDQKPEIH